MESTRKASVLIVDDNSQNLQLLGSIIYNKGYNVSIASSGANALYSVTNEIPDLILLDILMPGMDGFETCELLKSNPETKDVPIIFLTAVTDYENILHGFEIGAVDYITKPFNKGELLARVHTHIDLKITKEKLKSLNADKDKFFGIIAHDLRNPTFELKFLLQQMSDDFASFSKEELLRYLEGLHTASDNLYNLLNELLSWSKSQWGLILHNPENLNLRTVVDKKIAVCNTAADNKGIEIITTIDDNIIVNADEMMLNTVIINLLSNAIKFSKQHGKIEIAAEINEKKIDVSVKDSSIGIDKEELEKMFLISSSVYLRGSNKEEVSGLGLILCKEFVERNGGSISVKSEKDIGNTFIFSLKRELN